MQLAIQISSVLVVCLNCTNHYWVTDHSISNSKLSSINKSQYLTSSDHFWWVSGWVVYQQPAVVNSSCLKTVTNLSILNKYKPHSGHQNMAQHSSYASFSKKITGFDKVIQENWKLILYFKKKSFLKTKTDIFQCC